MTEMSCLNHKMKRNSLVIQPTAQSLYSLSCPHYSYVILCN